MSKQNTSGLRNVLYNFTGRLGSQVIGFVVSIYVIRKLPLETYGEYSILLSILAYVTVLASLGLANTFQRFIPEFSIRRQFSDIKWLTGLGISARFVVTVLVVGMLLVLAKPIEGWLHISQLEEYLRVYSFAIVLTLLATALDVVLTSLFRQFATNSALLLAAVLRGAGFYYVVAHQLGLLGLLIVELIAVGGRFAVLLFAYVKVITGFARASSEEQTSPKADLHRIVHYGGWSYLNELGYIFFNTDTDNLIISSYLGSTAVGLYSFANRVAGMIMEWSPVAIAANVISPLFFSRYARTQSVAELDRMFGMLNKVIYVLLVPVAICAAVTRESVVSLLFGQQYLTATWLLVSALSVQVFNAYQFPLGLVVFAIEKNKINFYSRIFSLYNLVADLILIHFWGVAGVLVATSSAVTLKNLFIYWRVTKHIRLHFEWRVYGKILLNATLTAGLLWLCRSFYASSIVLLALSASLAAVLYLILTYVSNVFRLEELEFINRTFNRKIIPLPRFAQKPSE